ncbi:MAG: asparagine synthase (glutamine-hydrolyzing) [Gammaproteobacteria bacterium]
MCGIAGVISDGSTAYPSMFCSASLEGLKHRGPDDKGILAVKHRKILVPQEEHLAEINPGITFFHRRLSILDLSAAGRQPMSTNCARYHIVFNGEVYNYIELRKELIAKGYRFKSNSDTEVVLNSFKEWKEDCVKKFVGMFALAIIDVKKNRLFLVRDPFGIKPLYYCNWKGGIAFSSEIAPLLTLDGVSKIANSQRVFDYLRFSLTDHGSETLFRDVKQVPAAHYLYLDAKTCKVEKFSKYWEINLDNKAELDFKNATQALRNLFLESIELHMRSDVVVGTSLSGGIDSSSIVCAMRYLKPDIELHTFSFIADDRNVSEEHWVDIVSNHVNSQSHKIRINQDDLISDMDKLLVAQGEPFAGTSIFAQNRVFQMVNKMGIKVMLDGQGADEVLAGYNGYQGARFATMLKNCNYFEAIKFLHKTSSWPGRSYDETIKKGLRALLPTYLQPIATRIAGNKLDADWLNVEWLIKRDVKMNRSNRGECKKSCLKEDLKNSVEEISLPHLLRFEDRNSMAYSVESRVPFLTTKIVEFLFSLPECYLIDSNGTSKAIFREAMRGIVPNEVLDRRDKIGFQTPEKAWLRKVKPELNNILEHAYSIPVFNTRRLEEEWKGVWEGTKHFDYRIWRWIDFLRWSKMNSIEFE